MTMRTITAMYDDKTAAEAARRELIAAGIAQDRITIVAQDGGDMSSSASGSTTAQSSQGGFWSALRDMFVSDEDRTMYAEGIRRGGYLLSARVDDELVDDTVEILEDTDAVDVDQRSEQWRQSGWAGAGASDGSYGREREGDSMGEVRAEAGFDSDESRRSSGAETGMARTTGAQSDGVIPVVEEHVRIGKREVQRGGVRVRSYVVEQPVEEQVTLRREHVSVERRPVNQPVQGAPGDLMRERRLEVTETSEEPVIAKEAVVTEEIAVRKQVEEETETVRDTVRHTEVEVENLDENVAARPVTPSERPQPRP